MEQAQVKQYPVAIIGAGPYGISIAAHFRNPSGQLPLLPIPTDSIPWTATLLLPDINIRSLCRCPISSNTDAGYNAIRFQTLTQPLCKGLPRMAISFG